MREIFLENRYKNEVSSSRSCEYWALFKVGHMEQDRFGTPQIFLGDFLVRDGLMKFWAMWLILVACYFKETRRGVRIRNKNWHSLYKVPVFAEPDVASLAARGEGRNCLEHGPATAWNTLISVKLWNYFNFSHQRGNFYPGLLLVGVAFENPLM